MRQRHDELEKRDIQVKVVTFDVDDMAQNYVQETGLPWPLLLDDEQTLYRAYGMTQASWWNLYGPSSIWKYLRLMAGGRKPGQPGKDWRQLGGDILIDPQGIVRQHFVSAGPHDRPSVQELLDAVDSITAADSE